MDSIKYQQIKNQEVTDSVRNLIMGHVWIFQLGVDRLSAPILSILPIIDIGHFQNRFADIYFL